MTDHINIIIRPKIIDITALNAVLDELIPIKNGEKMPGILELNASEVLLGDPKNKWLFDILYAVNQWAKRKYDVAFGELSRHDRRELIGENIKFWNDIIARIGPLALIFYFQNPLVNKALGLEFRPPFPVGHAVAQGNWDLLEPVYLRGQIYRDVE